MKRLGLIVSFIILILTLSGCEKTLELPKEPVVDSTLPRIESVKTLADITEIAFEWTPSYGDRVAGYTIYRVENGRKNKIATVKDKYTSHYVDTKLKPNTQYSYYFTTFSEERRESELSAIVTASTMGTIDSVTFISAITGLPNRVKIVWRPHAMERVESYIIERNEFKSTKWEEVARVEGRLNAEYIDTRLENNYVYRYRVKVKTFDDIISKPSDVVEAHTKPLPNPIMGLKASTDLPKKIILSWNPASESDFSHYKIYRSINASLFYTYHGKTKSTDFEDFVSDNGKTYYYKVVAVDVDSLESKQQEIAIAGSTLPAISQPVIQSINRDGQSVTLSWSGDANSVKYTVTKEYQSGGSVRKQNFTGIFETNYHDAETVPGVEYKYNVIAIDKFGIASNPSGSALITIPRD